MVEAPEVEATVEVAEAPEVEATVEVAEVLEEETGESQKTGETTVQIAPVDEERSEAALE